MPTSEKSTIKKDTAPKSAKKMPIEIDGSEVSAHIVDENRVKDNL